MPKVHHVSLVFKQPPVTAISTFRGVELRRGWDLVALQPVLPLPFHPMEQKTSSRSPRMADLRALEDRLLKAISAAAEETKRHFEDTKRHFDVVAENLTYDYRGIFSDRLEQLRDRQTDHERRLRRLEDRAGVIA